MKLEQFLILLLFFLVKIDFYASKIKIIIEGKHISEKILFQFLRNCSWMLAKLCFCSLRGVPYIAYFAQENNNMLLYRWRNSFILMILISLLRKERRKLTLYIKTKKCNFHFRKHSECKLRNVNICQEDTRYDWILRFRTNVNCRCN